MGEDVLLFVENIKTFIREANDYKNIHAYFSTEKQMEQNNPLNECLYFNNIDFQGELSMDNLKLAAAGKKIIESNPKNKKL